MAKRKQQTPAPLSDVLRRMIAESGLSMYMLSKRSGVERMSLTRFAEKRTSLRIDRADRLAAFFGLELVKRRG